MDFIDENGMRELCIAIALQAVHDYEDLCRRGVTRVVNDTDGSYAKGEITRFFRSKWGSAVLEGAGINLDGEEALQMVKANAANSKQTVAAYTPHGAFVKSFDSLSDASAFAHQKVSYITRCLKGLRKTSGGYAWKYI